MQEREREWMTCSKGPRPGSNLGCCGKAWPYVACALPDDLPEPVFADQAQGPSEADVIKLKEEVEIYRPYPPWSPWNGFPPKLNGLVEVRVVRFYQVRVGIRDASYGQLCWWVWLTGRACGLNTVRKRGPDTMQGIRVLVDAREKLHIPWGDTSNQRHGDTMMGFDTRSALMANGMVENKVFQQYLSSIRSLWADSGIQHAYDRRREFQLVSAAAKIPRDPDYPLTFP
ncbi:hypothetical protein JZ751_013096 [Albula glossodonta]|uniref:Uncharacterized protein n=1 Tax=Albula glossodonta TaxID=121402 RepID=A0A8T2P260_9TELE|nr:hypothetical protein JZ751_013096 [Albula glossodonta]